MEVKKFLRFGEALALLFAVTLLPTPKAVAVPGPGKVTFESASTNYEYEVGNKGGGVGGIKEGNNESISKNNYNKGGSEGSRSDDFKTNQRRGPGNNKGDWAGIESDNWHGGYNKGEGSSNTNNKGNEKGEFCRGRADDVQFQQGSGKIQGKGIRNYKRDNDFNHRNRRSDSFQHFDEQPAQESRRINIAIKPLASASKNTAVEVKVKKFIVTSAEHDNDELSLNSKSNEINSIEENGEIEQQKQDCRGLPWPFINALNTTNCIDLESEEFSRINRSRKDGLDEDEEDATVILPRKKKRKKFEKKIIHEEDFEEDLMLDSFNSNPLPQVRTYHDYAMMFRSMGPTNTGNPNFIRGPMTYHDFLNWQTQFTPTQYSLPKQNDHNWGWGWGWATTQKPTSGWTEQTTTPVPQRQPHELKASFGQPSQPNQPQVSFGRPSITLPTPTPSQLQSFGQPALVSVQSPQNQTRQIKAMVFGQPSLQQIQNSKQLQDITGYLAPAYYGYSQSPSEINKWNTSSTTSSPGNSSDRQQLQQSPRPSVSPISQISNQTQHPQTVLQLAQQKTYSGQTHDSSKTQIMDMYNRLLQLYKILINETSTQTQNQPPPQTGPPQYQANPWQVPPPSEVWADAFGRSEFGNEFYPSEILPGLMDADIYDDPLGQPKILPKPISPVRRRQFRRTRKRIDANSEEQNFEPRVRFINVSPTILKEVNNNDEFLPRRRYFKRRIDEKDLKKRLGTNEKRKKKTERTFRGRPSWENDYYYDDDKNQHPDGPLWWRHAEFNYQPPVYGPPLDSKRGWSEPQQHPGWGWSEPSTTQTPGWGWQATSTTGKPGWGWDTASTTTTTESSPPAEGIGDQNSTSLTEEGSIPGEKPQGGSSSNDAYLAQQMWELEQEIRKQLQASGNLPKQQPLYQQPQPQTNQPQQQQQQPALIPSEQVHASQQYIPTQTSSLQQPASTATDLTQSHQNHVSSVYQTSTTPSAVLDPVIEDIGSRNTVQYPSFRGQEQYQFGSRQSAARQLQGFDGDVLFTTVTSKSVSESALDDKNGNSSKTDTHGTVQQVSPSPPSSTNLDDDFQTLLSTSIPVVRQMRYSPSQAPAAKGVASPSWGTWGGTYSQTYSKVQNVQPYRILKVQVSEQRDAVIGGLLENKASNVEMINSEDGHDDSNKSS